MRINSMYYCFMQRKRQCQCLSRIEKKRGNELSEDSSDCYRQSDINILKIQALLMLSKDNYDIEKLGNIRVNESNKQNSEFSLRKCLIYSDIIICPSEY